MGFNEFLSSIFGNKSTRDMKEIQPWVNKVKAVYPEIEKLDNLSAGDAGLFLPVSIKSCLDGRLDQLEDRLSALTFRLAVETDMMAGILADTCQLSREELRRRRAESVRNVKATNGRISLRGRSREMWEEGDEWLD